jgi:hypothetical protein
MIAAPWYLLAVGILLFVVGSLFAAVNGLSTPRQRSLDARMRDDEIVRHLRQGQRIGLPGLLILIGLSCIAGSIAWRLALAARRLATADPSTERMRITSASERRTGCQKEEVEGSIKPSRRPKDEAAFGNMRPGGMPHGSAWACLAAVCILTQKAVSMAPGEAELRGSVVPSGAWARGRTEVKWDLGGGRSMCGPLPLLFLRA